MTTQAHEDKKLPQEMTVKMIMDTWTLQKGFPVIHVHRNEKDGSALLEQVSTKS